MIIFIHQIHSRKHIKTKINTKWRKRNKYRHKPHSVSRATNGWLRLTYIPDPPTLPYMAIHTRMHRQLGQPQPRFLTGVDAG